MFPASCWFLQVLILFALLKTSNGFNLDVKNPIIASGSSNSYFGYSLAVHEKKAVKKLLVGAPKEKQLNSKWSGAVYQCEKRGTTFACNPNLTFPTAGAETTDHWLGASIASRNGTVMVCAPRSLDRVRGECFYSREDNLSSFSSYRPSAEAFCEWGFSAALSQDGSRFYTGGPSCNNNAGNLYASTGPSVTAIDKLTGDIAFFAFVIATGKIVNRTEGLVVSIGFHQNTKFSGKVVLVDSLTGLRKVGSLEGSQPGEHFGASLAVFDMNNDGRDDIIVGAPHHTDYKSPEVQFDVGAVYIYYQTESGIYKQDQQDLIEGKISGAQFGFAVAGLGDTNGDGINDLAVGAPYENDGSGTVYIYHGLTGSPGRRTKPGQIISGNHFNPPISSFGFSFNNGASDFDSNQYSDLIVGAYQSNKVVYLPARPVVRVASEIIFNPEYIIFDKKDCEIPSTTPGGRPVPVACATLRYCLTYEGISVSKDVSVNITITLDVKQTKSSRLLFIKTNNYKWTQIFGLSLSSRLCQDQLVYLKPDIRDKLSPMDVNLVTSLVETPGPLAPILDIYGGNGYASKSLSIFRDCGPDLICIPDLRLSTNTSSETYIQGSNERWTVDVLVYNGGEDAFGAEFFLHLPGALSYINTDKGHTDPSIECFPPGDINGPVLRCEIGNPLVATKSARLRIIVQPNPGEENVVSVLAETNSTNKEDASTLQDNTKMLNLKFKTDTKLTLAGWSRPETLNVNITAVQINEEKALPQYTQFYEVRNVGPSDILGARFRIISPTHTPEGYAISVLIAQPTVIEGNAHCDDIPIGSNSKASSSELSIECDTDIKMARNQRIVIRLMARLSSEALLNQLNTDTFTLTSVMTANVTRLPFDQDGSGIPTANTKVEVHIKKIKKETSILKATPVWIPIVSAIGAVIIVAGIAALLTHLGFFKRNRPMEMVATRQAIPENQPLQDMNQRAERPTSERDQTVIDDSS